MTYQELRAALDIFSLGNQATLAEIKTRHRALVKQHHPDAGGSDSEAIRKINAAYRLLLDYVGGYRFSFSEHDFFQQFPEERIRRQFKDDPLWGNG